MSLRWLAMSVVLLSGRIAAAEGSVSVLEDETRTAREAAQHGHCETATEIGARVRVLDGTYYVTTFAVDPAIAACITGTASMAPPPPATLAPPSTYMPRPTDTPVVETDVSVAPPLSAGRLVGELMFGGMTGFLGGVAGGLAGYKLETAGGCSSEFCGLGGAVLGFYAGATLAVPLGVYAVGSSGDESGSLGRTFAGSFLGGLAGMGIAAMTLDSNSGAGEGVAVVALLAGPPVGALIGFNSSRRYRPHAAARATLAPTAQVTHDRTVFGFAGCF